MPMISRGQKKHILRYMLALFITWLTYIIPAESSPLSNTSTFLYSALIIVWFVTIRERVTEDHIRVFLTVGAYFLILLFILRLCKWVYFEGSYDMERYLWYAYYIPFIMTPLISLCSALYVGKAEEVRLKHYLICFWICAGILCFGVLTNDFHHKMFRIKAYDAGAYIYTYGPLYYLTVVWCLALTLAAFTILMYRCHLSMVRKLWYIPLLSAVSGFLLILLYFIVGGAPRIVGLKLYNIQEVYAFLYIFFWEGCIQIGLIPSNSDYEDIFTYSGLNACITDCKGNIVYQTKNTMIPGSYHTRQNRRSIRSGFVFWNEDLSSINEIRDRLVEVTQRISEENTLLQYENEAKEERAKLETQSKLYDETAVYLQPQLKKLKTLLHEAQRAPDKAEEYLAHASVIGAYIKRRSNLAIISQGSLAMNIEELFFSIRESLEYLSLAGIANDLHLSETGRIQSQVLVSFYELFETVAERLIGRGTSLMVNLSMEAHSPEYGSEEDGTFIDDLPEEPLKESGFCMTLMSDLCIELPEIQHWKEFSDMKLDLTHENGVMFLTISYKAGESL